MPCELAKRGMHFDMRELAATADPEPAVTGLSGWEGGLSQDDVLCVLADLGDERSGMVCVPPGWFGARIAGLSVGRGLAAWQPPILTGGAPLATECWPTERGTLA